MTSNFDIKIRQYESTVIDFINKDGGYFISASEDNSFNNILRNTFIKHLAMSTDCFTTILSDDKVLKTLKDMSQRKRYFLLFIERIFHNKDTSFLLKQIKAAYSNVKVIILTGETDRDKLVNLHEIGIDNIIVKPISINTLIEKIAFTIRPQGKIGKLIDLGKQMVSISNYENATKVVRQILELKPNSAAAYLILGDAYAGMNRKEKAIQAYEQASRFARQYMEPLRKLAQFHREHGNVVDELQFLEKLDILNPLNVDRKVDMGGLHLKLGNEERAEDLFSEALKQATKQAMGYIEEVSTKIANIYSNSYPEKAEDYYRKALEVKKGMLDKNDIRTFNLLGISLRRQGKWNQAIKEYQKALHIDPEDGNLHYNLAMAYAEGRQYRRAMDNAVKALELNPHFYLHDAPISYNLSLIFFKAEDINNARHYARHALKVDPNFERAQHILDKLDE